jgi:hypothetical protein
MITWLTVPVTELCFYVIVIVKKYLNLFKPSSVAMIISVVHYKRRRGKGEKYIAANLSIC